jgi:hypothetical protein
MRVLLVHPDDSPRRGPWVRERWDLVVDLGQSSPFSAEEWERQYRCPVLRTTTFQEEIEDLRRVHKILAIGKKQLVDREGIDWWDITSLLVAFEVHSVLGMQRMSPEISPSADLWSTRPGGPGRILALLLKRELHAFRADAIARMADRIVHYAGLTQRFSPAEIKQIFLDKYDSDHQWRSRFSRREPRLSDRVVLIPSAYVNVSRMAAAYARLLPEQQFLIVATRQSAKQFDSAANIQVRDLAGYVAGEAPLEEIASLEQGWKKLRVDLSSVPELRVLAELGDLDAVPRWMCDGLFARDAWREVIEREPVCGVFCGDDSNLYTRVPVLLAANRNIPTVNFHHGAFDGRYLLKDFPCDVYLAKTEAERDYLVRICRLPEDRIAIGAPPTTAQVLSESKRHGEGTSVIFFSEPYEVYGMRGEEVYRELLPALCRVARENGRDVIVKLHPFESRKHRCRLIREILGTADRQVVRVLSGPLTDELLSKTWFGITVESTTVVDCLRHGIPCFLCGWYKVIPCGYLDQYERFGIGERLANVSEVASIPSRVTNTRRPDPRSALPCQVEPAKLHMWLTAGVRAPADAKPA